MNLSTTLGEGIDFPDYQTNVIGIGIVHLGIGAFHRAHQAFFTQKVISVVGGDWAICGVSLRSSNIRDRIMPQNGLYSLLVRNGDLEQCEIIGSIREVLYAPEEPSLVLERMVHSQTRIVSLTITEKGYCHDPSTGKLNIEHPEIVHDLENPTKPKSAIGYLVQSLFLRRKAGILPFTVLSCDNLPENGKTLKNLVQEFSHIRDPVLSKWIEKKVPFPSSMVDRIVPATSNKDIESAAKILGVRDEALVVTEPFRQWVIEDYFCNGRPQWEIAGVEMVKDVRPFEKMKLRLLNGTHSTLAYLGYLAGYKYVSEAMDNPEFEKLLAEMMEKEIAPTLNLHRKIDLNSYQSSLLKRYKNPTLKHLLRQIAIDGSQKLPQRLLNTIRDNLISKRDQKRLILGVAAWMRYVIGINEKNQFVEIQDPFADRFRNIAIESGWTQNIIHTEDSCSYYIQTMLEIEEIFGRDLKHNDVFKNNLTEIFIYLVMNGTLKTVKKYHSSK